MRTNCHDYYTPDGAGIAKPCQDYSQHRAQQTGIGDSWAVLLFLRVKRLGYPPRA